jgi:hypothetical protein
VSKPTSIVEARSYRLPAQRADARGCELQRERIPSRPAQIFATSRRIVLWSSEVRLPSARAFDKQPYGIGA